MTEEKNLISKSETISITDIRYLKELSKHLDYMLATDEFLQIVAVYDGVIKRLLRENEGSN